MMETVRHHICAILKVPMTKPKTIAEDAADIEFSMEPATDWPDAIKFTDEQIQAMRAEQARSHLAIRAERKKNGTKITRIADRLVDRMWSRLFNDGPTAAQLKVWDRKYPEWLKIASAWEKKALEAANRRVMWCRGSNCGGDSDKDGILHL